MGNMGSILSSEVSVYDSPDGSSYLHGCYVKNETQHAYIPAPKPSVPFCETVCTDTYGGDTPYFGVSGDGCYCSTYSTLDDVLLIEEDITGNKNCGLQRGGYKCGSRSGEFVSIYRNVTFYGELLSDTDGLVSSTTD